MATEREKELMAKKRELNPFQRKLTASDGIVIDDVIDSIKGTTIEPSTFTYSTKIADIYTGGIKTDELYTPNPTIHQLTKAAYDALPYSKNSDNIAYFLTDIDEIKVWIGSFSEYQELTLAEKSKPNILFFIRQDVPAPSSQESDGDD